MIVNGKQMEQFETVTALLQHFALENRIVVVELNGQIVLKEQYATTQLAHDDVIEIVHFVGGG